MTIILFCGVLGKSRFSGRGMWVFFSVIAPVIVSVLMLLAGGKPAFAQAKTLRATELSGVLMGSADRHFFGLEAIQPGQAVALTLRFEAPDLVAPEEVNFVVLSEEGLVRFLAGEDPNEVALAAGSPLLFDPQENRRTALAPGIQSKGYTVIVFGTADGPMRYSLQVQGGLLRDDAGQSRSSVLVDSSSAPADETVRPVAIVEQAEVVKPQENMPLAAAASTVEPVLARRVTGSLAPQGDRHYFRLIPDQANGEVSLTLQYRTHQNDERGKLNVWILTQDGVRHLEQGGLIQELNLAGGSPALTLAGATLMRTTLAVAESVPYVVVVYNQMGETAAYTLNVAGAVVADELGQTNEAQAAVAEMIALGR